MCLGIFFSEVFLSCSLCVLVTIEDWAFPLLRNLLFWPPNLYFLPGYWLISVLLNQYKWQIFTGHKTIVPMHLYQCVLFVLLFEWRPRMALGSLFLSSTLTMQKVFCINSVSASYSRWFYSLFLIAWITDIATASILFDFVFHGLQGSNSGH